MAIYALQHDVVTIVRNCEISSGYPFGSSHSGGGGGTDIIDFSELLEGHVDIDGLAIGPETELALGSLRIKIVRLSRDISGITIHVPIDGHEDLTVGRFT